jgi:hypothetical protein
VQIGVQVLILLHLNVKIGLGLGSYNAGGLAGKKKPKAKKMKQGGLASKK